MSYQILVNNTKIICLCFSETIGITDVTSETIADYIIKKRRNLKAEELSEFIRFWQVRGYTEKGAVLLYACPCCANKVIKELGCNEVCSICFWIDDPAQSMFINLPDGENKLSLAEARKNYLKK